MGVGYDENCVNCEKAVNEQIISASPSISTPLGSGSDAADILMLHPSNQRPELVWTGSFILVSLI